MQADYLLPGKAAKKLYKTVKDLPIVDYHCHLSPEEIYKDEPFTDIAEMWLAGDHYKWRLMRACGVEEYLITGNASWSEKFEKYAESLADAAGHPLYHWSHMELALYFGIEEPLDGESAARIYAAANEKIRKTGLSPRKLMRAARVDSVCTTDDIADSLIWHEKLAAGDFEVKVLPSFRTDNVLLMLREGYGAYLQKLSEVSGVEIFDLDSLKAAIAQRLEFFVTRGCIMTDVGMPYFPDSVADERAASDTFKKILTGKTVEERDYLALLGNLYVFLGGLYKKYGLVQQWHLSVVRNANSALFRLTGADAGGDTVGTCVSGKALITMLDALNEADALPETIIYTLNEANAAELGSIIGSFRGVRLGAAWWFCDHKRGIREQLEVIAETSALGGCYGMLTDSRSFLSYARHDYFRRILCALIGGWVDGGEYPAESAEKIVQKISYYNIKERMDRV